MFRELLLPLMLLPVIGCSTSAMPEQSPASTHAPTPQNAIFELSLRSKTTFANPFSDASAAATFRSPSGKSYRVDGFYYGGDEWRIRFVPREEGMWRYEATLTGGNDAPALQGSFECRGIAGPGFIRVSKKNPFRYEYEDGTPFYPVGIQTCDFLQPDFDGPDENGKYRTTDTANWLKEFDGAINLVRTQLGQGTIFGKALPLIPVDGDPARYDLDLARQLDETFQQHRAKNISQILNLMQDMSLWGAGRRDHAFGNIRDLENYKSIRAANLPLQEQYIRYIVARYGCYVDIWEIFNEDTFAPPDYLAHLAGVIRDADPYDHLLTTNYARPTADWCDVVTFHEYMGMPASGVDSYLTSQLALYKSYGKLVQNTEFGNQGKLSNIDPIKWRLAVWTAFMNEGHILFWGQSGYEWIPGQKRGNANAYLGLDSRQHFRVHNAFVKDLPIDMRPVFTGYTEHTDLRTYGLGNDDVAVVYVHHFSDHTTPYTLKHKLMVHLARGTWQIRWIDPATGAEVFQEQTISPQDFVSITVPPVTIDLAAKMQRIE